MSNEVQKRNGKILFVNRYFWPDHSATAQMLADLAFDLAQREWRIEIITSRLSYDNSDTRYPARETKRDVFIRRVATTSFGRDRLIGRAIDYASFYLTAWCATIGALRRGDVLVVKTDPPLIQVPMLIAARIKGARQVNWHQDVYPELADALGIAAARGLAGRFLIRLRNWVLRRSAFNVAIGGRMAKRLEQAGVPAERSATIHNWADEAMIQPIALADNAVRAEWHLSPNTRVVGYSGNLGRAHDLATMLDAAQIVAEAGREDIVFLFIGGGALHTMLEEEQRRRGLTNIVSQPYQRRERLALSLTVADVHWLSLNPVLEGLIVPSKFYGAAASGRPILFIGDCDGEIAQLVRESECGWAFQVGDATGVAHLLSTATAEELGRRGANARKLVDMRLGRAEAFRSWRAVLASVQNGSKSNK